MTILASAVADHSFGQNAEFLRGIIDAVSDAIAVIDSEGVIVLVNESWLSFSIGNGLQPGEPAPRTEVGTNYLQVCQCSATTEAEFALNALNGIQSVLDGRSPSFSLEYPCHAPDRQRWFSMRVTPLHLSCWHGAVIAHVNITESRQTADALVESEELFSLFMDTLPAAAFIKDAAGSLRYLNRYMADILGAGVWLGKFTRDLFPPELAEKMIADDLRSLQAGHVVTDEIVPGADGQSRRYQTHKFRIPRHGRQPLLGAIALDVTERKRAEEVIKASEEKYRVLVETTGTGYLILDGQCRVLDANPEYVRLTGNHELGDIVGQPVTAWTAAHEQAKNADAVAQCARDGFIRNLIIDYVDASGRITPVEINATAVGEGDSVRIIALCRDITRRKQMEDQVRQLAFYDPLTNLANRRLLDDRLSLAMTASSRSGCFGALMFIDLDNFKVLNDTHGHGVGDLLLIQAADRLKSCVRDMDTVSRFGGDEFVVMISELDIDENESVLQAGRIAEKIAAMLARPYSLGIAPGPAENHVEHRCTASIGVALFGGRQASQSDVLKWADAAMYQAKAAGENLIRIHGRAA